MGRKRRASTSGRGSSNVRAEGTDQGDAGDDSGPHEGLDLMWSPSVGVALGGLVMVRMLSAGTTCIGDCDETFNYWEPLHYLLYGFGFQTWEYSPRFALRSYLYLMPSYAAAKASESFLGIFGYADDKPQVWLGVRLFWVVASALSEALMYRALHLRFGRRLGGLWLLLSGMSAGMFTAAPALLPSSAATTLALLTWSFWLQRKWRPAIFVSVLCVFGTGWPFVGVLFVPMLLHCLATAMAAGGVARAAGALARVSLWGLACVACVIGAATYVDSHYYGKLVSPTYNIIEYNVLQAGQGRGDRLYGEEPASFYLKNLFLNTTLAAPLAAAFPMLAAMAYIASSKAYRSALRQRLLYSSPAFLWLTVMFLKPHKEERFLYPAYPTLFLAAAFALETLLEGCFHAIDGLTTSTEKNKAIFKELPQMAAMCCVFMAAMLGMCRTAAVVRYHNAPCNLFKFTFYQELLAYWQVEEGPGMDMLPPVKVCMGGEWYRYPSSFYIPHGFSKVNVSFVRSSFHGQLPQHFRAVNGTSAEPLQPFNDANQEEEQRFVRLSECDYVLESTMPEVLTRQEAEEGEGPVVSRNSDVMLELTRTKARWETRKSHRMLDPLRSSSALRAFFIPWVSEMAVSYGRLSIFKRVHADPVDNKGRPTDPPPEGRNV